MSAIRLRGATSGTTDVVAAAIAGDGVLSLPTGTGTLATAAYVDAAVAAGGKVLQVVSVTSTTNTSTSSLSFVTTGLAASLTPASSLNKVLVFASVPWKIDVNNSMITTIFRGTVAGTNLGHSTQGMGQMYSNAGRLDGVTAMNFLDSPSTTASQTYTVGFYVGSGTGQVQSFSAMSSLTIMEISA